MPRKARIDAPGCLHHIICRGIERRNIFRDNTDRYRFLERLGKILTRTETPCYAWVLMPNHFHLLLRTGNVPIAFVMRRLLTGYVVTFNLRHRRTGKLFQNRYKSILCQENTYLLELVRYIHLNPVRGGLLDDIKALNRYPFCGQSVLMGKRHIDWQETDAVLKLFANSRRVAWKEYKHFVEKGLHQGRRHDLIGGGLLRSAGGWGIIKEMRKLNVHLKGDERILGDSDFVNSVLARAEEEMEQKYRLQAKGYDLDYVIQRASGIFNIPAEEVTTFGKQPERVQARSVTAYWAVRTLSIEGTIVGRKLGLSQSGVSRAVRRGEKLVQDLDLSIEQTRNA